MEELQKLLDDGHKLIPLKDGQFAKQPRDTGYADKTYGTDDLTGNVGMIIPQGMVDVDFDWPEAGMFMESAMPYSGMMFGREREDAPLSHIVYRCDLPETVKFVLPNLASAPKLEGDHAHTILELRTAKKTEPYHVMIPPSVHPSGEKVTWFTGAPETTFLEPTEISADDLIAKAGFIAGLSALIRFYPGDGMRDEFALAITGAMIRAGWDDDQIHDFTSHLCHFTGDEEVQMRATKAMRSRKRFESGRPVRGLTSAAKIAGIPWEWMRTIAVWLGWRKGKASEGPAIFNTGMVRDVSGQAWSALEDYVIDDEPAIFAHGETLARVDRRRIELLDRSSLTYELNRCAKWMRSKDDGWVPSNADKAVVDDMLSARRRDVTVPELVQLSTVPMFTKDGRLLNENGFDEDNRRLNFTGAASASGTFQDLSHVDQGADQW